MAGYEYAERPSVREAEMNEKIIPRTSIRDLIRELEEYLSANEDLTDQFRERLSPILDSEPTTINATSITADKIMTSSDVKPSEIRDRLQGLITRLGLRNNALASLMKQVNL